MINDVDVTHALADLLEATSNSSRNRSFLVALIRLEGRANYLSTTPDLLHFGSGRIAKARVISVVQIRR